MSAYVIVSGIDEMVSYLGELEIYNKDKKRALQAVKEVAIPDVSEASPIREIKTDRDRFYAGLLKRTWKFSIRNEDGDYVGRLYSTAMEDIENELGSETNMKHVGFFSRTIDKNMTAYTDIIINSIFEGKK